MNENFSDNNKPMSPVLDATQQQVLRALRAKETDEYPLGDWYLGALFALQNKYNPDRISQAAQSLRELLEKLPRVVRESDVVRSPGFADMRRSIYKRWIKDKERYDGKWKDKNVDGQLDKTLRKFDRYLELNQTPTRKEQIQSAIRQIDPMADLFDPRLQEAKRDQFHKVWMEIEDFAHHRNNPDEQLFLACFSSIDQIILDLLAPITAQNQQEIRTILEKLAPTEDDINSMLELIKRRGANYRFFFEYAKNPVWIPILKDQGFFNSPPSVKLDDEGYVIYPFWPPISYLKRVANDDPEQVVDILVELPKTDNPAVLQEICDIACAIEDIELSLKLKPWISRYVKLSNPEDLLYDSIIKILNHWIGGSKDLVKEALEISKIAVSFRADPMSEEKQARRLKNPKDRKTFLEPSPRFDLWEYQQILENGIRPLCEKDPYQIARILIDATANMIRLSKHQEDLDKGGDADYSEIWYPRLNQSDQNYPNTKERLVHTLTFACKKVYEKSPESIEALDQTLRNQRWKVFKRLRQHLYALHPNEQTLPWIREFILEHNDYAKREYHYEFQLMIRKACEYFGSSLLNEEERTTIFDAILSGPSKEDFRQWTGKRFTEEGFQQRQSYFHRMQLRPFEHLLTGKYQNYFRELVDASDEDSPSDEDYSLAGKTKGGMVSDRSPKPPEELAELGDEELLTYINKWQEERPWYEEDRYEDDQWIEVNIGALADAFQTVFKDTIISNKKRLAFWLENRSRIERPVYVRAIVQAIQEHVKEQPYDRLDQWFEFCEWVLSHPDSDAIDELQEQIDWELSHPDESREQPDWGSSRRSVGDFIGECLKEDMNIPFTARKSLANILRLLCTQFDRQLDHDERTLLNRDDQITEAINKTRSRALEDLVKFGLWVRRHDDTDSVPEVTSILEERFKDDAEYPLTMPEYAQLGRYYVQLWSLNQTWAIEHKAVFFPQDDLPVWMEAFGSFLCFTRPFKPIFEILRDDFVFALNHLPKIEDGEIVDRLGQHLFIYYLREVYPLKGEDSLLERFYEKTKNDPQWWTNLSNHVGWSVRKSSEHLEQGLIDRTIAFFDWRLAEKEPEELRKIAFWLEAEYFDPDWRLDAYAKILDVGPLDSMGNSSLLRVLNEMLESHTEKVVKCFAKITDAIDPSKGFYIDADKAKPILKAGLNSEDESVRENAERARETLLNAGRYSFLDI